jgi:lipopolysaccharide export system protein LptC
MNIPATPEEPDLTSSALRADRIGHKNYQHQKAKDFSESQYSRYIRLIKLILPLLGVLVITVLLTWPNQENPIIQNQKKSMEKIDESASNELLNPRFESKDNKQQPFTLTAKRAFQNDPTQKALITLEKPFADIILNGGNWVAGEAETGLFNQDNQDLKMEGGVRLFHDDGYEIKMPSLLLNLADGIASATGDIAGAGPDATLSAQGLSANTATGILIFKGPARLVLKNMNSSALMPSLSLE